MSRAKKQPSLYDMWVGAFGLSKAEFQELFAQEVHGLTRKEMLTLKSMDWSRFEAWTDEQVHVFRKMFARATVKAKRRSDTH